MSLQVNTHATSVKALHNTSRANNLLNMAINGPSGGMKSSAAGDDSEAHGMAEPFLKSVSGSRKKPAIRELSQPVVDTDKLLVSSGGLARMEGLFTSAETAQPIEPEIARNSAISALRAIAGNPIQAMNAQANQRSDAVMKLLE